MRKIFFAALISIYGLGYAQLQIWTEGFEGVTFPPAGWTILDISGTKTWERNTVYHHSGTGCARHDFAQASQGLQETALVTSPITIPSYGNPTLDFWSRIQLIGYQYSGVLISTTVNNDINAFTEVKVLSGAEIEIGSWKPISIPLNNYLGQTIYIAFLYKNTDGHQWYIDDVAITHFEGFIDIQAVSITPATDTYPMLSENEPITVRLKNNGGNAASGFNIKLLHNDNVIATETFTGSIPSAGEATYTFNTTLNLSAAATHKIQAVVVMPGDQVPANDMATAMVTNLGCSPITTFPFIEGFENNGENLPLCWTQKIVQGAVNWRVLKSSTFIPNMDPDDAFEGEYRAVFFVGGYGHVNKLTTPPLNLTSLGNPVLKFHHIQQRWGGDQDSLKVYYRTSTQNPWILIEKYTDEVLNWTERVIPLPNPTNEYYIAFEGYHNYGRSVQIDNLIIGDFFETDIAVSDITPKGTHLDLSSSQAITATIRNNGRTPVSGVTLSLFVNENFIATENFTGVLSGMGEVDYTFNATIDMSISGRYAVKVVADLTGDEVPENNALTVIVRNLVCDALTFPYDEGFEENVFPAYCWNTNGPGWERRTYGGHNSIARAVYPWWEGTLGWLITPQFSIPAGGDFMMEFWSECYEARFYTYSGVWISTTNDNPASFTEIHELTYDERPESEWVKIELPLTDYAGKDIYIAFKYRNNGGNFGHMWSIDDFNIYNLNTFVDAELTAITAPTSGVHLTDKEDVVVKIKNNGTDNITNFPLTLEVDGALLATETFTGFIASMHETTYIFSPKIDLSEAGKTCTITVTVNVEDDENADNNSKTITVTNLSGETAELYGYRISDQVGTHRSFVKFSTDNPNIITELHPYTETTIAAGEYARNSLYFYTLNADNGIPVDFVQLDAKDFSLIANTPTTYEAADMTLDPTTNTLYGITHVSATESRLVSISFENGITTPIGNTGRYLFTIACNSDGEMYAIDAAGNFCSVNKTTGATSVIGNTGVIPYRSQSMTFNNKGRLFWAMYNNQEQGKLFEIQPTTGVCYDYGMLGDNAEIVMLYDPLNITAIKDITDNENTSLKAWVKEDRLYVEGLNIGDSWNVYTVTGTLVEQGVARSKTASMKLNVRGVYIIQSGNRRTKAVY